MPTLPQLNYSAKTAPTRDNCQTPPHAIKPLIAALRAADIKTILEPCAGEMYLANSLHAAGFTTITADIQTRSQLESTNDNPAPIFPDYTGVDFLTTAPGFYGQFDAIVTNPHFSGKYEVLEKCYQIGKPFALLVPTTTQAAGQAIEQFKLNDVSILQMYPRINYKMPRKGWEGSAQFPSIWLTYGLPIEVEHKTYKIAFPKVEK